MITPKDIENSAFKSGYAYVHYSSEKSRTHEHPHPYQAKIAGGKVWFGKRRATPLEAAQEYCDFINGSSDFTPGPRLKRSRHKTIKVDREVSEKRLEAYRLIREAREEENGPDGMIYLATDGTAMKIGNSIGPAENRLKGMQTGNPRLLRVLAQKWVPDRIAAEKALQTKYEHLSILNEWFKYDNQMLKEFK